MIYSWHLTERVNRVRVHDRVLLVEPEKDYPSCACGCGKKVPPGGYIYIDDYLYDKDCWFRLAIKEQWIKEVS
jgi:hypothetical protein